MEMIMNVPKLRFPEFSGEWEKRILGDVLSIFNGFAFSSKDSSSNGVLWVKIADVGIQEMKTENLSYLPNNFRNIYSKFVLVKGDYVISLTRPILNGKLKIAQVDEFFHGALLNQRVGKLETNNSKGFIYCYLQRDSLIKSIENNIAGTDPPNLSSNDINSIELIMPNQLEQKKIGVFFNSIDERLVALKKKKCFLEQYKKGVMHKLLTQELQFKDENGKDFTPWEEVKLGEMCEVVVGGTPSTQKREYWDGKIGWIGSGEIKNGIIYNPTKYITDLGLKESSTCLMPSNTVVLAMTGATLGKIGILASAFTGNQSVAGFLPNSSYSSFFLFYFMQYSTNQILTLAAGAAQIGINKNSIENLMISLPSLSEQTKIASFLTSLDTKIAQTALQIEKMQLWKKGLLQQMFV